MTTEKSTEEQRLLMTVHLGVSREHWEKVTNFFLSRGKTKASHHKHKETDLNNLKTPSLQTIVITDPFLLDESRVNNGKIEGTTLPTHTMLTIEVTVFKTRGRIC